MIDQSTFDFLADIKKNNQREWYHANKDRFKDANQNFIDFVAMLLFRISEFDPDIIGTEPKDCLFRIYRDIRFSKDKTPYKTWFGAGMNPGGRKRMGAGYYIHIEPNDCYIAGGVWHPDKETLSSIREYIVGWPNQFESIVNAVGFRSAFGELRGDRLKVAPKGYPKDHPQIEWLKYKDFIVRKTIPTELFKSEKCLDVAFDIYSQMAEFIFFLRKAIN
ncbi:MAG: DUF2461 domain-containing protein [Candidatus Marinimicrobia bacterium]|nr:DUF2461 domain-containing protein [Candidatus Neomarinimicrobiota bacterium]MBL7011259.1 DUF2461 domain-containing protein [Candidatus Neomarinimicrobiota bacterium]